MSQENINENNVEEVVDKKEEVVAEETSTEEVAAEETSTEEVAAEAVSYTHLRAHET